MQDLVASERFQDLEPSFHYLSAGEVTAVMTLMREFGDSGSEVRVRL